MAGRVRQPQTRMNGRSAVLGVVHNEIRASLQDGGTACVGPFCTNRFEGSGPRVRPKRYCSKECRQQASVIRRAAVLLADLPPSVVLAILARARDNVT